MHPQYAVVGREWRCFFECLHSEECSPAGRFALLLGVVRLAVIVYLVRCGIGILLVVELRGGLSSVVLLEFLVLLGGLRGSDHVVERSGVPQLDVVLALLLFLCLGLRAALEGRRKRRAPVQCSLCVRVQLPLPGVVSFIAIEIHVGHLVLLEVFLLKVALIHLAQRGQFSSACPVGEGIFTG